MKMKRVWDRNAKGSKASQDIEELVVQRLSSAVSRKAQKYTRVGPREFMAYNYNKILIENIKAACKDHFKKIIDDGQEVDILAGEQGPSCMTLKHIKNLGLIFVRFIEKKVNNSDDKSIFPHHSNF